MTCNYAAIRSENVLRYGTDIGRIGKMLLANRYDDRTHFIYELLQNAEDALVKRGAWNGRRSVQFHLARDMLHFSHFGKLFDERDVRGICGIDEGTKDLTAIGHFGIGFKSVYAFTDRPEVHSGDESFAIDSFVWPAAVTAVPQKPEETLILLPLRDPNDAPEIESGLKRLGAGSLLFLRAIDEIEWNIEGGSSGFYMRSQPDWLGDSVRRVTVIGQTEGLSDVEEESWLIFSKLVSAQEGSGGGHVEIAFSLGYNSDAEREMLRPMPRSPLVVYFPTALETHLGFLIQGPYRTTPSRDNVPYRDPWNRRCVQETAALLVEALHWLRDNGYLTADALGSLPLDRNKFSDMFNPLFMATKEALKTQPLLPCHDGGFTTAAAALIARTQQLRELFNGTQMATLLGINGEVAWLIGDISQDRTPELRQYLRQELGIDELRPEQVLQKLDSAFLEAQTDDWILKLYEFLNGQRALRVDLNDIALVRLTNGHHVTAHKMGQPQAFLPGKYESGFPTVRLSVCSTEDARAFLQSLGLTEPDPVDDVIRNILPKYRKEEVRVSEDAYTSDIASILAAFTTDSKIQREKLLSALRETPFLMVVDAGNGQRELARPGDVYLTTDRLKELFAGIPGIQRVDDSCSCLRGESIRELFESCGATRYLRPISIPPTFTWGQLRDMRIAAGCENNTYPEAIEDQTLYGLDSLLVHLQALSPHERKMRARHLWNALIDLEDRRGSGTFSGSYHWFYYYFRSTTFDAAFVRTLNEQEWVPDPEGNLHRPSEILFDSLGWESNPFLLSKIHFRPPVIEQLAHEAGIEPGVLDLLKRLGVTSEAQLRERLGVPDEPPAPPEDRDDSVTDALGRLGITTNPSPPVVPPTAGDTVSFSGHGGTTGDGKASGGQGGSPGGQQPPGTGGGPRSPGSTGDRPFISYVGAHPDDEEPDPDGLDHTIRMALEEQAIALILSREPRWQKTPPGNAGYDLFEPDPNGQAVCWCEVKAMTGSLTDRPVGLSRAQFGWARERGLAYWLYIVEHAGTEQARIVRIKNPAGKVRTFTFDRGWLSVAETDSEPEKQEK